MSERSTLTVFHGGTLDKVLKSTAQLAARAASTLEENAQVLYVNTLVSEERAEHELRKACRQHAGAETRRRILLLTVPSDDLMSHAEFVEKLVESRNVRLLVLNSFDFAAMFSRRRMRLICLLLHLRDFLDVDVVAGFRLDPSPSIHGPVGHLVYQASRTVPIEGLDELVLRSTAHEKVDPLEENSAMLEAESDFEANEQVRIRLWQRPSERNFQASKAPLQNPSLKTNELPVRKPMLLSEFLKQSAPKS